MSTPYLPAGLPSPGAGADGLRRPYWEGTRDGELLIQRCKDCGTLAVGTGMDLPPLPSFDLGWERGRAGKGRIYSWERPWHPVHPALNDQGPYIVVLVELPDADNVRMVGNLSGRPDAGGRDRRRRSRRCSSSTTTPSRRSRCCSGSWPSVGARTSRSAHCRERATPVALMGCVIDKDAPLEWRAPGKDAALQ